MNFNYCQDCLRDLLGALVPIQIIGKEEIRISGCKHKKVFLENIKSVIKMRIQVAKMLDSAAEPCTELTKLFLYSSVLSLEIF
jgi:hypothetical protein